MAPKNKNGNYLKISASNIGMIAKLYKDKAHREAGDCEFLQTSYLDVSEKTIKDYLKEIETISNLDEKKTLNNALKTIAYKHLKANECSEWEDC